MCLRVSHSQQNATVKLFNLSRETLIDRSLLPEAQRLQDIVAQGDFTIAKTSVAGTKDLLQKLYGYGGFARKPVPAIEPSVASEQWVHPHVQNLVKLEKECGGKFVAM